MHLREVVIDYTNHRGERRKRLITPGQMHYGSTEYHPEPQWLLDAFDYEKGEWRTFAMRDIHSWEPDGSGEKRGDKS